MRKRGERLVPMEKRVDWKNIRVGKWVVGVGGLVNRREVGLKEGIEF